MEPTPFIFFSRSRLKIQLHSNPYCDNEWGVFKNGNDSEN